MKQIFKILVSFLVSTTAFSYVIKETKSNEDFKIYVSPSGTPTEAFRITGSTGVVTLFSSVAFDTDTLYIDAANNRVGINTTSPAAALQVGTGSPFTAANGIQLGSTGAPPMIYRASATEIDIERASNSADHRVVILNSGSGVLSKTATLALIPNPNAVGTAPAIQGFAINDGSVNPGGRDSGLKFYTLSNDSSVLVGQIGAGAGGAGGSTDDQLWRFGKSGETGAHRFTGNVEIKTTESASSISVGDIGGSGYNLKSYGHALLAISGTHSLPVPTANYSGTVNISCNKQGDGAKMTRKYLAVMFPSTGSADVTSIVSTIGATQCDFTVNALSGQVQISNNLALCNVAAAAIECYWTIDTMTQN